MPAQFIDYALKYMDRRTVEHIGNGSSSISTDNHTVQRGRVLPATSVTIAATKRMALHCNYEIDAVITMLDGITGQTVCPSQKIVGLVVIPGPCRIVMTNSVASPEADGAVSYVASCAS